MTETMLVRTTSGAWEQLSPQTRPTEGGLTELFGDDMGPVIGRTTPLIVAASAPKLTTGRPDGICVDGDGNVTIVALALAGPADKVLASLLGHAGALHGMAYDQFEALCNAVGKQHDGRLAGLMAERCAGSGFHRGTFEVTVGDALAQGRFDLVAMVGTAPATLVQSMRYLNASGASIACYEAASFASASVMAVQARAVDVGQTQRQVSMQMSAAGLFAATERTTDEVTAKLMSQLQNACGGLFDNVQYDGDAAQATMTASVLIDSDEVALVSATSDGSVCVSFEALAPVDASWTVRAELVQGMNRMLGADLGDVKKISQLNLNIGEHLMDATLMDLLTEILGETVQTLRESSGASARAGALTAAA